jgi:hypothetical protein
MSWVWFLTWALWGAVVYRDWRREPRDGRWLVSLLGLVALAGWSRGSQRDLNWRFFALTGLALLILAAWGVHDLLGRRRRDRLARWAADHGFEPMELAPRHVESSLPEGLRRLPMMARGNASRSSGLVRRREAGGDEVLVFEHRIRRKLAWYDLDGAEMTGTVVALRRPGMWLPLLQVRPVGLLPGMDGGAVGDAVTTAPGSAFARSYRLGGHEPRNLRGLFGDDLLAHIAERPGWLIEGEGEWLAAFYFDRAESLMSLKTSALRVARIQALEEHARDAYRVLEAVADRGMRPLERGAGAA